MNLKPYFIVFFAISLGGCALEANEAGVATQSLGESDSALCRNALSAHEEKTVLQLIDNICGDTWCEGENDFAFERLTCRTGAPDSPSGTCTLKLRLIPRDDGPRSYVRTCTTDGFFGFDSLVETTQGGYQSLDWDYYLALTDCVQALEAALIRP